MKYGLVVFDFDGTLADSFPWFAGAINQLADRYKFNRVAPHEFDTLRRWDSQTILKHLRVPFWKIPLMGAHMRALMNQNIQHIHPFAGVQQLLPLLAERGAKLGMVSSNSF